MLVWTLLLQAWLHGCLTSYPCACLSLSPACRTACQGSSVQAAVAWAAGPSSGLDSSAVAAVATAIQLRDKPLRGEPRAWEGSAATANWKRVRDCQVQLNA